MKNVVITIVGLILLSVAVLDIAGLTEGFSMLQWAVAEIFLASCLLLAVWMD